MTAYSHISLLNSLNRLFSHLSRTRRWQLAGLTAFMLAGAMAEMATLGAVVPFFALLADPALAHKYPTLQKLFAFFGLGWSNGEDLLFYTAILIAIIAISSASIRIALSWVSNKFTEVLGADISGEVYRRTLYQPYSFHVARNTSEIVAGVNKVNNVISGIITPLIQSMVALLTAVGILTILLQIDWFAATFAIIAFSLLYLAASLITRPKLRANGKIIARNHTHRVQALQEGLGGIRDVLIDSTQSIYISRYKKFDNATRRAQAVNCFISASPRYAIEAVGMILILGLAFWLSQRAGGLASALPVLGALALGAQKLLPQMQSLYNCWAQFSGNQALLIDVLALLEQPIPEEYSNSSHKSILPLTRQIAFRDVGFRYRSDTPEIISNFSLEIPRGSRIGFIGKTGSGKSTMIDLIAGLLEPTRGCIEIDGEPLSNKNRLAWQARIAHVPQAVYLADTSIAENIAFGIKQDQLDFERVKTAANKAQLADFIDALPEQYMTLVGERGVRLSGGQRQRIGLARAFYKQAEVLILDEATSALDNTTEKTVMQVIDELGRDVTILMIAHRLTTLSNCDLIVELRDGGGMRMYQYAELVASEMVAEYPEHPRAIPI